jgi:hypothetical protein
VPLSAGAEFEPKACAASQLPAAAVTLGTELCAAVPLPSAVAVLQPKACAVSLRLTVVVTVGPEICPVVLLSAEVMVLATEVCAAPLVPATVIRPDAMRKRRLRCGHRRHAGCREKRSGSLGEAGASFG